MEIKIHITEEDYLHYAFMNLRRWRGAWYHVFLISMALLAGSTCIVLSPHTLYSVNGIAGIILLFIAVCFILVLAINYFMMKKEYNSNSFLKEEMRFVFDNSGFSISTNHSDAYINYVKIVKIMQSKKMIAIYISNHQAYLLPKLQLNTQQVEYINQLILAHLNAKTYK